MGIFLFFIIERGNRAWTVAAALVSLTLVCSKAAVAQTPPTGDAPSAEQMDAAVPISGTSQEKGTLPLVGAGESDPQLRLRSASALIYAGLSRLTLKGASYLDKPVVSTFGLQGAYGFRQDLFMLEIGGTANMLILPYDSVDTRSARTSWIVTGLALVRGGIVSNAGVGIGLTVGAGLGVWDGLAKGNPFTVQAAPSDGPVPLPAFVAGGDIEWEHSGGLVLRLAATYMAISTPGEALRQMLSGLERVDLTLAIGLRF